MKVEVWDVDPNADDKIDFYAVNINLPAARNEAAATTRRYTLSSRRGYST